MRLKSVWCGADLADMGGYRDWMKPTSDYVPDWRGAPTFPEVPPSTPPADVPESYMDFLDLSARLYEVEAENAAMRERIRRDDRALNVLGWIAFIYFAVRAYGWVRDTGWIG